MGKHLHRVRWLIIVLLVLAVAFFFRERILSSAGLFLTSDDARPATAVDAVIYPTGEEGADTTPEAISAVSGMVAAGEAKFVLMSCVPQYATDSCQLGTAYLERTGHFQPRVERVPVAFHVSGRDEAVQLMARARQLGMSSAVVLLPAFKTRRLGGVYKRIAASNGMRVFVRSSAGMTFNPRNWWQDRDSAKRVTFEIIRCLHITD